MSSIEVKSVELTRQDRVELAKSNLNKFTNGEYRNKQGMIVKINHLIDVCNASTILYRKYPTLEVKELQELKTKVKSELTNMSVTSETTIAACLRLRKEFPDVNIVAQNFASANHPGGGFLTGAIAQEEACAYASTLYTSLAQDKIKTFYDENKRTGAYRMYNNDIIWSPNVAIIRNDINHQFLDEPCLINFISCPGVNNKVAPKSSNVDARSKWDLKSNNVMEHRIRGILTVAKYHNAQILVLGSFACGVFAQDPNIVAKLYAKVLNEFAFQNIIFAIPSSTSNNHVAFKKYFK